MTASAAWRFAAKPARIAAEGRSRGFQVVAPRELLALGVVERLFGGQAADALQALLDAPQLRLRRGLDVRRRRFGGGLRRFGRGGRGAAARRRRRRSLRSAAFVRAPSSDAPRRSRRSSSARGRRSTTRDQSSSVSAAWSAIGVLGER